MNLSALPNTKRNIYFTDIIRPNDGYVSRINLRFSTANLSDIISDVEIATSYDIFQLALESVVSLTCILGSILTILVLKNAALNHPAQALRLALAVSDLMIGVFGSAVSLYYHSYYLMCATHKVNCQYEVDVVRLVDNGKFFVVSNGFSSFCYNIQWIGFIFGNFLIVVMSAMASALFVIIYNG